MVERRGHFLALALLAATVCVAALGIALPINRALQIQADLQAGRERLAAIRNAVREGREVEDPAITGLLVPGGSAGRAAGELQNRLGAVARRHGVAIRSANVIETKRQGELSEIPVEISYQTGMTALRGLLHEIETGTPLLIVDELNIRALAQTGKAPAPAQLDVSMKVRGFATSRERP